MSGPEREDEKALLTRLRSGDYEAFNAIYGYYGRLVAFKLHKLIKIPEIVEEVHQDIFLKLWENRGKISSEALIKPYLLRMATNAAIDFIRKAARDQALQAQLAIEMSQLYDDLEHELDFTLKEEALKAAIEKLPPRRQEIFKTIKLDGHTYEYAAELYGVSFNTVKDHMEKAMKFLKKELVTGNPATFLLLLSAATANSLL